MSKYKIFSGTATNYLFDKITDPNLLAIKSDKIKIERFSDKEISVKFTESIRGCDIFLFAETSNPQNFMELLLTLDAIQRSDANSVSLIVPYYGYGRQDKQESNRGCLGASLVAEILKFSGIKRILTIDLHAEQIKGFFRKACDHLEGHTFLLEAVKNCITPDSILVAPDSGGSKRVEKYQHRLNLSMVQLNKRRRKPNEIHSMELIGSVEGKDCIVIDDIIDTCGTLKKAAELLKENGAKTITFVGTHAVLSGAAYRNLSMSPIDKVIISDTLYSEHEKIGYTLPPIQKVSCIGIIEQALINLLDNQSVSDLNEQ